MKILFFLQQTDKQNNMKINVRLYNNADVD